MKSPESLRSWAERIKKSTRVSDIIEFCDDVVAYINSKVGKSAKQRRRERAEYQRIYMRAYRKRQKANNKSDSDMGDFAE